MAKMLQYFFSVNYAANNILYYSLNLKVHYIFNQRTNLLSAFIFQLIREAKEDNERRIAAQSSQSEQQLASYNAMFDLHKGERVTNAMPQSINWPIKSLDLTALGWD